MKTIIIPPLFDQSHLFRGSALESDWLQSNIKARKQKKDEVPNRVASWSKWPDRPSTPGRWEEREAILLHPFPLGASSITHTITLTKTITTCDGGPEKRRRLVHLELVARLPPKVRALMIIKNPVFFFLLSLAVCYANRYRHHHHHRYRRMILTRLIIFHLLTRRSPPIGSSTHSTWKLLLNSSLSEKFRRTRSELCRTGAVGRYDDISLSGTILFISSANNMPSRGKRKKDPLQKRWFGCLVRPDNPVIPSTENPKQEEGLENNNSAKALITQRRSFPSSPLANDIFSMNHFSLPNN